MTQPLPPPLPGSRRAYWICQCVGWYGYALAMCAALVVMRAQIAALLTPEETAQLPPLPRAALEMLVLSTFGIGVTHLLRAHMRRNRWDTLSPASLAVHCLLAGLTLCPVLGVPQHFMSVAALQQMAGAPAWVSLMIHMINWAPLFWIWMAIYFVVLESRKRQYAELRQSELTRELQSAQLRLLKAQVNPHFLFNSLNSVRALIAEDKSAAIRAVTQLARTLRYSLASGDPPELVTLDQELETIADYLELEGLRLGERLRLEHDIDDDALPVRIPVMLVQTLAENAIKHGIAELPEGGTLRMSARVRDGSLRLEIENPRPRNTEPRKGEGIGLRNGHERLRLLFGDDASLDLDLSAPDRAVARLRLPVGR